MLNPNDGVCYVKINGPAGPSIAGWDWKVPSQSYCQLPGPWESLGVYYLDQSGSGRAAEINVYELDSSISVPSFIAIGRAVQMAGSTMDISTGSQPSNPPTGSIRLWVDGNNNLHLLAADGTDVQEVDTNDPLGPTLLQGTLVNPVLATRAQSNFSNASGPQSGRVHFQTSEANQITSIGVAPNGSASSSQLILNNNSDVMNASRLLLREDGTAAQIWADQIGSGTLLPIIFYVGGAERLRINTDASLTLNNNAVLNSSGPDIISQSGALIAGNGFLFIGSQKDVYFQRLAATSVQLNANLTLAGRLISNGAGIVKPIGFYVGAPSWSSATINTWLTPPFSIAGTFRGLTNDVTMIDLDIVLVHNVANAQIVVGLAIDGSLQHYHNDVLPSGAGNVPKSIHISTQFNIGPGSHTITCQVYNRTSGTLSMDVGSHTLLRVYEVWAAS